MKRCNCLASPFLAGEDLHFGLPFDGGSVSGWCKVCLPVDQCVEIKPEVDGVGLIEPLVDFINDGLKIGCTQPSKRFQCGPLARRLRLNHVDFGAMVGGGSFNFNRLNIVNEPSKGIGDDRFISKATCGGSPCDVVKAHG